MFGKLFSANTFKDVGKLDAALRAVTSAVSVDDTLSNTDLLKLASSMRGVTPDDIQYFTAPIEGTGKEGPASVVYLNDALGERMWQYLRNDSLAENAAEFSRQALPDVPR
jgi:hypothetical protein